MKIARIRVWNDENACQSLRSGAFTPLPAKVSGELDVSAPGRGPSPVAALGREELLSRSQISVSTRSAGARRARSLSSRPEDGRFRASARAANQICAKSDQVDLFVL